MPCNDPVVNRFVDISTKVRIDDHNALASTLYELAQTKKIQFYEETEDGYRIITLQGDVIISFQNGEYKIKGDSRAINTLKSQITQGYQSIKVQNALIDKGYLTEKTPLENNVIQIQARRF